MAEAIMEVCDGCNLVFEPDWLFYCLFYSISLSLSLVVFPRTSTYPFLLLLLAQLLVLSLSRPTHPHRLSGPLKTMSEQMTILQELARTMMVSSTWLRTTLSPCDQVV